MQKSRHRSGIVSGILLPMGLICLFAFCSLALALMGGRAYKQIQGSVDESYGTTVAASYLRTKLSQNNSADAISLRDEGGTQVLVIATEVEGKPYETRIFLHDGQLVEVFSAADAAFDTAGGNVIAPVRGCAFSLSEGGLFTAELESEAGEVTRTAFAVTEGGRL